MRKKLLFCLLLLTAACSESDSLMQEHAKTYTDSELFSLARAGDFTFYKNNPDTLPFTVGGGGHGGFIRVKFNPIASAVLTDSGKLPLNSTFPNGSLVVKEIYNNRGDSLTFLAVMLKNSAATNAAQNWVWGEYYADGRVLWPVNRGADCVPCHSLTKTTSNVPGDFGHRDFVRTFGLRP
ncbi:MAG: cytochrome P460 family protein [Chloroherpetonaceae bacterium]